jgi:hypothetical protein
MDLPCIGWRDVAQRGRDPAFGHHGMGLAQERLADQADVRTAGSRLDGGAQTGATGSDDEHVVGSPLDLGRIGHGGSD